MKRSTSSPKSRTATRKQAKPARRKVATKSAPVKKKAPTSSAKKKAPTSSGTTRVVTHRNQWGTAARFMTKSHAKHRIERKSAPMQMRGSIATNRDAAHIVSFEAFNAIHGSVAKGRPLGEKSKKALAVAFNQKSNLRLVKQETNRKAHVRRDGRVVEAVVTNKHLGTNTAATRAVQQFTQLGKLAQSVQERGAKNALERVQSALGRIKLDGGTTIASQAAPSGAKSAFQRM